LLSLHERGGVRQVNGRRAGPWVAVVPAAPESETGDIARSGVDRAAAWRAPQVVSAKYQLAVRRRLIATDVASLLVGWSAGWAIGRGNAAVTAAGTGIGMLAVGLATSLVCLCVLRMYQPPFDAIRSGVVGRLIQTMSVAALVIIAWQAALDDVVPQLVFWSVAGALVAIVAARYAFDVWLIERHSRGEFCTTVVVAGVAMETAAVLEFLELNPETGFAAAATVGDRPSSPDGATARAPWMGHLEHTLEAVRRTGASGVLVAVNGLHTDTVNDLVVTLSSAGIPVYLSSGLTAVSNARLQTLSLAHEPITLVRPARRSSTQQIAKRTLDVVVASVLLLVTAPVIAVTAALIKAHDRGPVFFRQVRIGRGGEPFTLIKLRTMEVDAEARLADLRQRNERHGPLFKVSGDPRITPIGGLLRSAAIDELPQLFNVLRGHMGIVGPRPALPAETAEFDDDLQRRHLVRPGVTGLWQVEANHKASFEEYRRLDLFYVDNWSVAMDLAVIIDTIPVIGRRALRALRRPAPSAPAPVGSAAPVPKPIEVGP
jgi:exopolysaccharide biosynthesis polyprenyl glycosylphosphotransferase